MSHPLRFESKKGRNCVAWVWNREGTEKLVNGKQHSVWFVPTGMKGLPQNVLLNFRLEFPKRGLTIYLPSGISEIFCQMVSTPGVPEIDRRLLFMHSEEIRISPVYNDTLPTYSRLPTKSLNGIRVHQEPTDAPNRTSSLPCKRARNLIPSKLPCKLTLRTRKSIRVGEVSAQKETVFVRYWEQSLRSAPLPLPTGSWAPDQWRKDRWNGRVHTPSYTITSLIPPLCTQPSEHSLPLAARIRPGTHNLGQVTEILGLLAPGQA